MDEVAALPSPRVLLSRQFRQYYGRLRRPPGTTSTSRLSAGYKTRISDRTRSIEPPGRGGPPQFPPPPSERSEPPYAGRSLGAAIQDLHPFHGLRRDERGSAPPLPHPNGQASLRRGRLRLTLRTAQSLPQKGFRRCASTLGVSPQSRQPATGPPDSYPDRTYPGWRRRAYVGSATQ
jgi:hypothetical protein